MPPLGRQIYYTILYGVGLTSIAAVVYMAGPYVVIGDFHPLDNYVIRELVILLIVTIVGGVSGWRFWKRRKSTAALAEGLTGEVVETDEAVLKTRMDEALATLKTTSKGIGEYLYDLPWYVIIGPPGSGKTTALVNSGLKFPLSAGATPAAIAGIGGTRYCDWWFTEDGVLIDTAGRYTTQDANAGADRKSWLAFLDLLKKNRPRQPINGVLVAIALNDIITSTPLEREAHANAIRSRLVELHDRLKVDFPVYVLFTKTDLVAGFSEFFGHLGEHRRREILGATFQTADRKRNMVADFPAEFDALILRLNDTMTDRLQDEPAPSTRVALFGFPAQMATLKKTLFDFLNKIFEPTRYHANATLRGFYFTSGTQEGTPIDQLIGALVKTFGAQEVRGAARSGLGKSFFLHDLIGKLIFGEAEWVSSDRGAIRRARIIKAVAYGLLALVCVGASALWWTSFIQNRALITATQQAAEDYATAAGPLARETRIGDHDFGKVLPLLHKLKYMPTGYASRGEAIPVSATFGLSQHGRLRSASETAYHLGLERLFRPRLIYRLEEVLDQNRTNPSVLYEALKVYLMLGGLHAADPEVIAAWMRRDWNDVLYPGAANAPARQELETHLAAMADLDDGSPPLVQLNGDLVRDTQNTLARLSLSQRGYELLRAQARVTIPGDWTMERAAGPDALRVFDADPQGSVRVPGFYTYAGFRRALVEKLGGVTDQLRNENWVLGEVGQQGAVAGQFTTLQRDILDLYARDFVAAWQSALTHLRLKRLTADKPAYVALASAVGVTSPIRQILESIRDETALTRDRPGFAKAGDAGAAPVLVAGTDQIPGANVEGQFKPFHILVEGDNGRRPVDVLVSNLADIYQSLLAATNPAQAPQANAQLQTQVAALRSNANRFPPPFAAMMQNVAGELDGDLTRSARATLSQQLGDQVTGACQQIIANRYPFTRTDRDVSLLEFGRLFSPNGVIDGFFRQRLAQYVDTSKPEWVWRRDTAVGQALSQSGGALRDFQRAAVIRDTFFAAGGSQPALTLTVTPPPLPPTPPPVPGLLGGAAPSPLTMKITMDVNGTPVASQTTAAPAVVQWPGAGASRSAVTVADQSGMAPASLERNGPWSFFRLVDAGSPIPRGDRISVSYIVGGRELQYQVAAGTGRNPFTLPELRDFRCPSGL